MAEKPLIDISPENWKIVRSILQRYVPDREVWAFGSRAKWTAKEFSDLDIAVVSNEPMSIGLVADLDEAFQESALPFKVDVVDWATITPAFRQVIQAAKIQIQESQVVENWTTKLLSDIAYLNPSRSLKKGATSPFIEMAALPVNGRDISVQDVSSRDFSGSGSRFVNGDVLLARITPCLENGKTALVNVLSPSAVGHGSTEFIVLSAKESSDQRFIYYLARHPDFREYAIQHMEGTSGRQRVSATSIGAFRFLCPPLVQRKEIGDTLGALDDKISLLRETSATLEAIAQALFKSWFVDFDPVRAKAEGREPEDVPPEIAELFPSEFEVSKLGEIPKGWQAGTLSDFCFLNPESWSGKNHPESIAYIDLANVKENRIDAIVEYAFDAAPSRARRILRDNDTIVGTVRPGNRSYAFVRHASKNLTGSTGFAVLRPQREDYSEFVYFGTTNPESIASLANLADGGAYPAVRPEVVQQLNIVKPPAKLIGIFHDFVAPLMTAVSENMNEAASLGSLRDALLPKLMAGVLQVEAASS